MKCPTIKVDPSALRHGLWGNTWKQWGWILLAFASLYALLGGYLTGMLFAALGVRQDDYRTMSSPWFGPFDRTLFTANNELFPTTGASKDPNQFNRPDNCVAMTSEQPLPGFPEIPVTQPTGVLQCSNDDQWRWTVYPWVLETNGLGRYEGCANPEGAKKTGASYISQQSSPAAGDAVVNNQTEAAATEYVCQNGVAY